MNLRLPSPINRRLMLEAVILLVFAALVGIFAQTIIPLLAD
jgi:hypothetical protein